jgi:hypothetical protein
MHENTKPELSPAERQKVLGKLLDTISERERRKALYQRLREDPAYETSKADYTELIVTLFILIVLSVLTLAAFGTSL